MLHGVELLHFLKYCTVDSSLDFTLQRDNSTISAISAASDLIPWECDSQLEPSIQTHTFRESQAPLKSLRSLTSKDIDQSSIACRRGLD
jgi:hypothetical protein